MASRIGTSQAPLALNQTLKVRASNPLRAFLWSDLLALIGCGYVGAWVNLAVGHDASPGQALIGVIGVIALVYTFRAAGHYRVRQALADQLRPLLKASLLTFLATSTAQLALGDSGLDAGTVVKWLMAPAAMLALRYGVREVLKREGAWFEPVTLIARTGDAEHTADLLSDNDGHGLSVHRSVDLESFADLDDDALGARLSALGPDTIFLAPDAEAQPIAARLAGRLSARGTQFYYKPALGRIPTENVDLLDTPPADGLVLRLCDSLDRPVAQALKRLFDIVVASLALIVLSPVLALIAVLIRRDGGSALFVQPRAGRGGEAFGCLKFRTMAEDAEARLEAILAADPDKRAEWDAYQKLDDDPRITQVGHILRATSLDELPQLINVVKGEMSLIGPRPMLMDQMTLYGASLDAYVRMRPGITGLWQVNGRNATTFAERARLDDWYARNWSLWRDVVILVRTVRELITGSGR